MSTNGFFTKFRVSTARINMCSHQHVSFSSKIVQAKLFEIRSRIEKTKSDSMHQFEKENYLQRYNLTPSKHFIQKHPILLEQRSLKDLKNLLHLLHKRCGFNDDHLLKMYQKYPAIIEQHPDDIVRCLHEFKRLGFNHCEAFLRLEPSILLTSSPWKPDGDRIHGKGKTKNVFMDRLKFYKEILTEIGVANECELLEKHCVHIIQKEPQSVLGTLRFYERFGLDIKRLLEQHAECMVYSLSHVKKVIHFVHQQLSDVHGVDVKILTQCPQIFGLNLMKLKKVIAWLSAVNLFQISEILKQCPELLVTTNVDKLDQSFKCLTSDHGLSRSVIQDNLWLLLLSHKSLNQRIQTLTTFDEKLNEDNIELLRFDHNHIAKLFRHHDHKTVCD